MTKYYLPVINTLEDQHINDELGRHEYIYLRVIRDEYGLYVREEIRFDSYPYQQEKQRLMIEHKKMIERFREEGRKEREEQFSNFIKNGSDIECYYDPTDRRL